MKSKNLIKQLLLFILLITGGISCTEKRLGPEFNDGIKPAAPTDIQVTNLPGGATISYRLPKEPDLGGVEAQYTLASGKQIVVKSSGFTSQIKVDGFAKTQKFTVTLTSFDQGGNYSDPVKVEIEPLTPPVESVFKSLKLIEDWGGVSVQWQNQAKAPVAILILAEDTVTHKEMDQIDAVYTSIPSGKYSTRGLKNKERKFGVVVRDRWENYSDTIFATLTPLKETKFDKTKFREVNLPTDEVMEPMQRLWDDDLNWITIGLNKSGTLPQHFTFDLGVTAKLSRFIVWPYSWGNNVQYYYNYSVRYFEIWGSVAPNPNGSWDGWTKLRDCEVVKPSGLPVGPGDNPAYATDEDIAFAKKGFEFTIPNDAPDVRYIRIVSKQAWLKTQGTCGYGDIDFYGRIGSK